MAFLSSIRLTAAALMVSLISVVTISQMSNAQSRRVKFSPPTPPDPGIPPNRGQGGHRGPCEDKYPGVNALVPKPRPNLPEDLWGLTVSDRPIIWFNVPTGLNAGTLVEWRLRDAKGKTIYKTSDRLSKVTPGIISFSVPASTPLAIATYQWDLAVYCNSADKNPTDGGDTEFDRPLVRKGRIQRVAMPPALQKELAGAKTPLEQANVYGKYGIWYDALTALGSPLRTAQSPDKALLDAWRELLQQQQLTGKESATITACCKLEELAPK